MLSKILFQGFAKYLQQNFRDISDRGVIIGYDARHNSKTYGDLNRFAKWSVRILMQFEQFGILPVYFWEVGE